MVGFFIFESNSREGNPRCLERSEIIEPKLMKYECALNLTDGGIRILDLGFFAMVKFENYILRCGKVGNILSL